MKHRIDFVTNSSSSSFVLAFNDTDEDLSYESFKERCQYLRYEAFFELIDNLKDSEDNTKEIALDWLYSYYSTDYKRELLETYAPSFDFDNPSDQYKKWNEISQIEEFKQKVRKYVETQGAYQTAKRKIEDSTSIIVGRIWDTNGGILGWAIRSGFIQENFPKNHVLTWDIG